MAPKLLFDLESIDLSSVQYSLEEIRELNAQRHEFEQLTAVVLMCTERQIILGRRDIEPGEFWERGHVPGNPLFPGVLMIEAAAQLCCVYIRKAGGVSGFYGLGGVDKVRFRERTDFPTPLVTAAASIQTASKPPRSGSSSHVA